MTAKKPFTNAVRALAEQAQETVHLPGKWVEFDHPYIRDITRDSWTVARLFKSEAGAYGISVTRTHPQIAAELFASRAAHIAGVPVPPTFLHDRGRSILSVIPFAQIVTDIDKRYENLNYLRHHASTLPFLLWLGNDTDRRAPNMVANAQNATEFAEFDFESSDLTTMFQVFGLKEEELEPELHSTRRLFTRRLMDDAHEISDSAKVYAWDALQAPYIRAYNRLLPLFDSMATRMLELLVRERIIEPHTESKAHEYFMLRQLALMLENKHIGKMIKKPANAQRGQVLGTVYKFG